ncbi:AAA family ATPase [Paenibacillus campinasensis]|uniref:AAA family ATPase n=1 Tax=Paenibacillus campinasensis TaxID=66347 RepID=A0ABW9T8D1_9BACL|nr:ATP-binding protein [Paenibacillus campinasensis]MUG68390.1 AAA family ATPase [Paenibacillus campinasensis]
MIKILEHLPKLIRSSLMGDNKSVELYSLTLVRLLRKDYPEVSEEIAKALSYRDVGSPVTRAVGIEPPPSDRDNFMMLAQVKEPPLVSPGISLNSEVTHLVERFILERTQAEKLLAVGVRPPTSLLLYGPPGVGKTMLADFLSFELKLPLITLDLASTISSFLGKTGQNLKKVIEYAKKQPSILLLDEFDAVAKRRDDPSDLGELKRIVNVLLKELEDWPTHSIVIAATNHPEILDKAIWRRFDRPIEVPLPDMQSRKNMLVSKLPKDVVGFDEEIYAIIAEATNGLTGSDINQISERVLRKTIIDGENPMKYLIQELKVFHPDGKFNQIFARAAKGVLGNSVTQAEIASWLGISPSTVNHHLKKEDKK